MVNNKITIIMPVYNVERFIRDAINSVLIQSTEYGPLEFIIVDDGSPDNCPQIIDEMIGNYHGSIKCVVIHKKNEGVRIARNDALERATGDWIMFIDSDDRFEPDAIKIFREYMAKYPEADYFQAAGDDVAVDEGVKTHKEFFLMNRFYPFYNGDAAKFFLFFTDRGPHATPWAKVYRKDIIGDNRFNDSMKLSDDFEFNMRVWRNVSYAVCIKDIVYVRNRQKESITEKGLDQKRRFLNEINVLNALVKSFEKVDFSKISEKEKKIQKYIICRYLGHMERVFNRYLGKELLSTFDFPLETDEAIKNLLKKAEMYDVLPIYEKIKTQTEKGSPMLRQYQRMLSGINIFDKNGTNR